MAEPQLEFIIICDDIREEKSNKRILVGVYNKYLLLDERSEFPIFLPQLALYARWRSVENPLKIYVDVDYEGQTLFQAPEALIVNPAPRQADSSDAAIHLSPFELKGWGKYVMKFFFNDRRQMVGKAELIIAPQSSQSK